MFFPSHIDMLFARRGCRQGVLHSMAFRPRCHVVPAASAVPVLPLLSSAQRHLDCNDLCLPHSRSWQSQRARTGSPSSFYVLVLHTGSAYSRCSIMLLPVAFPHHFPLLGQSCVLPLCAPMALCMEVRTPIGTALLAGKVLLCVFTCLPRTKALCKTCHCCHCYLPGGSTARRCKRVGSAVGLLGFKSQLHHYVTLNLVAM